MLEILLRRGQPAFRKALLNAYEGRCAMTGCDVIEVIEAAHIVPYRGAETNRVSNGLLLRGDVRTLFDLGYITVDETTLEISVASDLVGTEYGPLHGALLRVPDLPSDHPSRIALRYHRLKATFS